MIDVLKKLTIEVSVSGLLEVGPGAKVHQFQGERSQVDQNILILYVSMDDAGFVAADHSLQDLPEEQSREFLVQDSLLCDEVEEVFDGLRPLHDDDVGIQTLEVVQEPDDARDVSNFPK